MTQLDSTHLSALVALAERCSVDGGSPGVWTESFVHRRFFAEGVYAFGVIEADELVAAGSVNVREGFAELYGLVDPDHRGRGLGTMLLEQAAERGKLRVRTEALTPDADRLFAAFGLRRTFAEDVMRHDLGTIPAIPYPAGTTTAQWSDDTKQLFFATYQRAFQDRPGFPDWTFEQWTDWTVDEDFRPDLSLLATKNGQPVAFVTCSSDWIIQVGVDPAHRGQRLGAALIADVLARMDGKECWLDVNANNPGAADLYHSLGFVTVGRRATFE